MVLEQLLRRLAPFGFPFGSMWVVLVVLFGPSWIAYGGVSIQLLRINRRLTVDILTKETPAAILYLQMRWATHSRALAYAWNVSHMLVTQSFHLHSLFIRQLTTTSWTRLKLIIPSFKECEPRWMTLWWKLATTTCKGRTPRCMPT